MEDLEARLRGRGTEKEEDVQKRLANAAAEMEYGKEAEFDKYLVNDDLARASADLSASVNTWFPHLSEGNEDGKNSFSKGCATICVIS
mmetsp:Transcript_3475/g.5246  ORF Transcript_3475/g.5246 Transcript_3475/m.5246 type:complete len:88 (+) Transcript_3475:398-661(+)